MLGKIWLCNLKISSLATLEIFKAKFILTFYLIRLSKNITILACNNIKLKNEVFHIIFLYLVIAIYRLCVLYMLAHLSLE